MNEFVLKPSQFVIQSPPGDTLLETLEAHGMAQSELALRTGRPLKTINEIIKGKAAITPETALQFERVLGISATFWLNREQQYRESQARQAERQALQQHLDWLKQFPLEEMVQLRWLRYCDNPLEQVQEFLHYFGLAKPDDWLSYWTTTIPEIQNNPSFARAPGSTTAWLRQGELQAQAVKCDPYRTTTLRKLLPYLHDLMASPADQFYADLKRICAQAGIAFCMVRDLPGVSAQRLVRWLSPTKAFLQIRASHIRPDEFWYSVYHGLGHILLHGKRDIYLEEGHQTGDKQETEADHFAKEHLHPQQWSGEEAPLSWEFLQRVALDLEKDEWENLPEETALVEQTPTERFQSIESLALYGWPGLSAGARRALLAAGMADEAGRVDEQLFSRWVTDQLAAIYGAFTQGYLRDALADLENLASIVRIGMRLSPALGGLSQALELITTMIEQTSQPYLDPRSQLRGMIQEAYQPIQDRLVLETRKSYSTVATKTENSLAENLFRNE